MSRAPVRVIRAVECRRMPWKNGGGETIEIAVHPGGAGLEAFEWRVSAARVETDGPFSMFPGVDRTLAILEGDGLELRVGEEPPAILRHGDAPHRFPADRPTRARLLGGPITDLNVMTRRGRIVHDVRRLSLDEPLRLEVKGEFVLLFCAAGTTVIDDGPTLQARDCAVFEGMAGSLRLAAEPDTVAYLIEIRSSTS